jgi:hypothetical protein
MEAADYFKYVVLFYRSGVASQKTVTLIFTDVQTLNVMHSTDT